jgi:hypothetical protein
MFWIVLQKLKTGDLLLVVMIEAYEGVSEHSCSFAL